MTIDGAAEDDIVAMTARLPRGLHEELRAAAFEGRVSMNELLLQGLVLRLRSPGQDKMASALAKLGCEGSAVRPRAG